MFHHCARAVRLVATISCKNKKILTQFILVNAGQIEFTILFVVVVVVGAAAGLRLRRVLRVRWHQVFLQRTRSQFS